MSYRDYISSTVTNLITNQARISRQFFGGEINQQEMEENLALAAAEAIEDLEDLYVTTE